MRNKKGDFSISEKTMVWIAVAIIFGIMAVFLVHSIEIYNSSLVKISPELIETFYVYRFLNNPGCFAYQDSATGRVDAGLIDMNKFTAGRLAECYKTNMSTYYNFLLKLEKTNVSIKTQEWWNIVHHTVIKNVRVLNNGSVTNDKMLVYVQRRLGD